METWTHVGIIQRVSQQNRPAGTSGLVGLVLGDSNRAIVVLLDGNYRKGGNEDFRVRIIDPVVVS